MGEDTGPRAGTGAGATILKPFLVGRIRKIKEKSKIEGGSIGDFRFELLCLLPSFILVRHPYEN